MRSRAVQAVLEQLKEDSVLPQYVVLGGNAGDALIDLGFFALAEEVGLRFDLVLLEDVDPSRTVIISGSGGLVKEWSASWARQVVEELHRRVAHLVILPSTIRGQEELLADFGDNVTVFTRERQSYDHALQYARNGARVLVDHDMAFNLDARKFIREGRGRLPRLRGVKDLVRLGLYAVASLRGHVRSSITVRRGDAEGVASGRPRQIYNDLSFVTAFRGRDGVTLENTGRLFSWH